MFVYHLFRSFVIPALLVSTLVSSAHAELYIKKLELKNGHIALLQGKNETAVALFSKLISDPQTDKLTLAKSFLKRGVAFQRLGHMTASINNFNYAENLKILPQTDMRDLFYNRAISYHYAKRPKMALQDQQQLQQLDGVIIAQSMPSRVGAPTTTASIAKAAKPAFQAQKTTTTTTTTQSASIRDILNQAHNNLISGQNKQAIKQLTSVIQHRTTSKPLLAESYLKRGVAKRRIGQIAASIADFTHASDLNALPKSQKRDLLFNRAQSYKAVGLLKLAQNDTEQLKRIDGAFTQKQKIDTPPTHTASIKKRRSKKPRNRHVRRYVAVAKPKNLVEHLAVLLGTKKK